MVIGDWGLDRLELYVPDGPGSFAVDSDDPDAIPGVREARTLGFEPLTEAPLWCYLPAIWPNAARTWVRDARIRHAGTSATDPEQRIPWSTAVYFEMEADYNRMIAAAGFPPRPPGRLWLLKPPPGFDTMDDVLIRLSEAAEAAGERIDLTPGFAGQVDAEVRRLFSAPPAPTAR